MRSPDERGFADRVYGALLRCYPASFRARFEPGMRDSFSREHASVSGPLARARFWGITCTQAVAFGMAERWRHRGTPAYAASSGGPMFSFVSFDVRDAWRSLRATPLISAVAILSLGLGIGANTALFSILNGLVLRPLPVRAPHELLVVGGDEWTNAIWEGIRDSQPGRFAGALSWGTTRFDLARGGQTEYVDGSYVSGSYFDVLGLVPHRGRLLTPADDVRGGESRAVAVISAGFWQRRFGGRPDAIGQVLTLDRVPFTIVGIAPTGFLGADVGRGADVFVPLAAEALIHGDESMLTSRATWWLNVMIRRASDQTPAQAEAALVAVQPRIREAALPTEFPPDAQRGFLRQPLTLSDASTGLSSLRTRYVQPLTVILVIVGLVLLVACANIANLLLARATARQHELSLRLALGASRARLMRQLLTESLMLAAAGALLSLVIAEWGSALLVRQLATSANSVVLDVSLDWRVLAFTGGVGVLTSLLFGLAPALGVARVDPNDALKSQGRGVVGDRRFGLRNLLVVAQVALSLVLLVAAGLFIRSFVRLATSPLGFNPEPLLIASVNTQQGPLAPSARAAAFAAMRDEIAALPGIRSAAVSVITPVSGQGWNTRLIDPEPPQTLARGDRAPWVNGVTPGWFDTYGMRVVAGRDFQAADRSGGPCVVIVNEIFARRFLEGRNPVGRTIKADLAGPGQTMPCEVVGQVSDAVYRSVRAGATPTIYLPLAQVDRVGPSTYITVALANGAPATASQSIIAAIARIEPAAAVSFRAFGDQVRASMLQERLVAWLSGIFGALALVLAGLGLYGVTSYAVTRRRMEIGVRMALGADRAAVARTVLARVAWTVAVGAAVGAAASVWAVTFVGTLLFQLDGRNPTTFIAAVAVLALVGALAGWLPARRAARLDPSDVLRNG